MQELKKVRTSEVQLRYGSETNRLIYGGGDIYPHEPKAVTYNPIRPPADGQNGRQAWYIEQKSLTFGQRLKRTIT